MTTRRSAATNTALELIAQGLTPYAAAHKAGIALSTIYRALKRNARATKNTPHRKPRQPTPAEREAQRIKHSEKNR